MRGSAKNKDPEEYEDQILHQTIGGSRIRSHSAKYGSHRIHRHHHLTTTSPSSSSLPSASPGAAGTSASSVSSYLENLPSVNLDGAPPPRPPRPPGGLLGISNGRGIGYGRSLGSSYDSPFTIQESFNGHVRSGANLYGARNPSSGLSPIKPSPAGHHRPSMSVFPIQKALEIAVKESRLLAAASSRGGSGPSGTGMIIGKHWCNPAPSAYCVDDKKRSPLHFAAASGDLELVEFLLERGVRPDCGRDIAGNMPLHLAIISNRIDVVAALLKAGADMTLASPMTHKTPLDLAESRLSYLLARAQESVKRSQPSASSSTGGFDFYNSQIVARPPLGAQFNHHDVPSTTSPALLYQIRGIVNLLGPYVTRQQKLQHGDRHKERQKERSWERADKYMRQHGQDLEGSSSSISIGRADPHSEDNFGDMEDEAEDGDDDREDDDDEDPMDSDEGRSRPIRNKISQVDMDGDMELNDDDGHGRTKTKSKRPARRLGRRMDANETGEALENLMNGLSLLEANRKQMEQQHHHHPPQLPPQQLQNGNVSDSADGNLADNELDPRSEHEVDEALPDLLEQVQQVLEAIKLNESQI
ncbi:hypothetical protein BGX34_003028 [Mortierella sp. NVP85]|nr:hypothetical protein BGX34_003028 [Mortierella sp. NVP85]